MNEGPPRINPKALLARLESLKAAGVEQLPVGVAKPPAAVDPPVVPEETALPAPPPEVATPQQPRRPAAESLPLPATLEVLAQQVADCTLCTELSSTRRNTVFGSGDPNARLVFLGEAPGADEDRSGEPFVGAAGQLLTKIIEACNLTRDEVYILNVLKCRPPGNRNPAPQESANCKQYLHRQLELIDPEYICCLGAVAAQNLLDTTQTIGRMRGKIHAYRGIKVVCTYHPAYLLRNPSAKKDCWADMKMLMGELGVQL